MRYRELAFFIALGSLIALPLASAQQPPPAWPAPPGAQPPPPAAWPESPAAQQQTAPAPKGTAKKARKKAPVPPAEPDPRLEEEPLPEGAAPPAPAPKKQAAAQNILCDGPFAKDTTHEKLAKAFGARNVLSTTGGASTIVFPNDIKRRVEVTWRDMGARARPASILVEGQSAWRVRGFRLGDAMAQVEKANGKPFKLAGFADGGGNARDWQGGKLDNLSGGCVLGMRFAPNAKAAADARAKLASGEFVSDSADVRAVKPVIVELIVGYGE